MDNYERNNRIELALNIRGVKAVELAEMTGLSQASISHWMKQRWQPKSVALGKMAKALDVSEMWLAGYDCPMERPAEQKKGDKIAALSNTLRNDDRLANLIFTIVSLTDSQLDSVENLVNEFSKLNQK